MSTFHVNKKGEPGPCGAEKGGCPFGGSEKHFTSPEAARAAYEADQKTLNEPLKKSRPLKQSDINAMSPEELRAYLENFDAATATQYPDIRIVLKAVSAYAKGEIGHYPYSMVFVKLTKNLDMRVYAGTYRNMDTTLRTILSKPGVPAVNELERHALVSQNQGSVRHFLRTFAVMRPEEQELLMDIPVRYFETLKDLPLAQTPAIASILSEVELKNPGWKYWEENLPEVAGQGWADWHPTAGFERAKGRAVSMQDVDPPLKLALERYVVDTYGADNAEDFWQSVKSAQTSSNRPLLSHFLKVEEARRKEAGRPGLHKHVKT